MPAKLSTVCYVHERKGGYGGNFYVEENLGDREPCNLWVEVRHDPNVRYLSNKMNRLWLILQVPPVIIPFLKNKLISDI
ncbi:hypothetical protein RhiirC2_756855 [Rhizophagus irregularis]|uniref:Uncharacterized protein n=1 Tax=Rhizophagus irregularis TaxID=588596 RepID=A0A2N1MRS2_9GLOM|nr:hypothetical protein RhiirC2_756855 [Rhizophagus irregularis]